MADTSTEPDPRVERSRRVVREAALHELAEAGYGGFTIDAVASRCGVARSTIYRHWPDKASLIVDAFDSLNRQPPPAGDERRATAQSPRDRIAQLLEHLAGAFKASIFSACIPSLIEGADRDPRLRTLLDRYNEQRRSALVRAISDARTAGEVAHTVEPEVAAVALAGAILYRRTMTAERFDPSEVGALMRTVLGDPPAPARSRTSRR